MEAERNSREETLGGACPAPKFVKNQCSKQLDQKTPAHLSVPHSQHHWSLSWGDPATCSLDGWEFMVTIFLPHSLLASVPGHSACFSLILNRWYMAFLFCLANAELWPFLTIKSPNKKQNMGLPDQPCPTAPLTGCAWGTRPYGWRHRFKEWWVDNPYLQVSVILM